MTQPLEGVNVLMLVENEPVPRDVRVWLEAVALTEAGAAVTVVCPLADPGSAAYEILDDIEIHRYPARFAEGGAPSYALEYGSAFWHMWRLSLRLARTRRFDVVHVANPPDLLLLAAKPLKRRGAKFVFDQHDAVPELYLARFGRGRDAVYRTLVGLERMSYRFADLVIVTNESYRLLALERGRMRPDDLVVIRNGPDLARFSPRPADRSRKRGKPHLIAYVGVIAPQDGVDHAIRALALLRERRDDWHAVFVGDGDAFDDVVSLARELELGEQVEFLGYRDQDEVVEVLAAADVALSPEPKSALNQISTMVKVAEYMAMGVPVVAYDLAETRFSAGDAAAYAAPNETASFAARMDELLDDSARRAEMGDLGLRRAREALSWDSSRRALVGAYARLLRRTATGGGAAPGAA